MRVMVIFGTRPEAIKLAPVLQVLQGDGVLEVVSVTTGQHREMLEQVMDAFSLVADENLDIFEHGQSLGRIAAKSIEAVEASIQRWRPDLLLVQGDTTTTFAGALAGFYSGVPVAHLEAGLRTGNLYSPFPEEANRRLTGQITSLHLAPTMGAKQHLISEGVAADRIHTTGNTVIDALIWTRSQHREVRDETVRRAAAHEGPVLLVTSHRRESWGAAMAECGRAIADVARARPDLLVVIPIHRNPVVRAALLPPLDGVDNVVVCEPIGYVPFVQLMDRSTLILTDSGGIQEEGPTLGKPVLVMRETTERPEAVRAGTARLVGTSREAVRAAVLTLLEDEGEYARMAQAVNPYGDGLAAVRAVEAMTRFLGLQPKADHGEWAPPCA